MDLSHNKLSGQIYSSLDQISVANVSVDLSSNELEGPIPLFVHLQSVIFANNKGLGPGTLVGSAAFNLFCIHAVWTSIWTDRRDKWLGGNSTSIVWLLRIEILGALVSIQMIWLLASILVYEANVRLIHDSGEVQGFLMFGVAAFGVVVNIVMAVLLGHDHGHSHGCHDDGHSHGAWS
ncbi:hypothetical protein IFM89_022165 [Coptis chinensis]|uniref:Cation efflux protein transmembrane domain-containing protein n=1 Tax=Coptis chinensis TaxID=261450 RepID=A0A835MAC0_9MAGN|nr:hypothetical protein IFM89_022165 [Coptis chinensis]